MSITLAIYSASVSEDKAPGYPATLTVQVLQERLSFDGKVLTFSD
jgi:hypothetical protein